MTTINADIIQVLSDVEEYLEPLADVLDGPEGQPTPNQEMRLLSAVQALLSRATSSPFDTVIDTRNGGYMQGCKVYGNVRVIADNTTVAVRDVHFISDEAEVKKAIEEKLVGESNCSFTMKTDETARATSGEVSDEDARDWMRKYYELTGDETHEPSVRAALESLTTAHKERT